MNLRPWPHFVSYGNFEVLSIFLRQRDFGWKLPSALTRQNKNRPNIFRTCIRRIHDSREIRFGLGVSIYYMMPAQFYLNTCLNRMSRPGWYDNRARFWDKLRHGQVEKRSSPLSRFKAFRQSLQAVWVASRRLDNLKVFESVRLNLWKSFPLWHSFSTLSQCRMIALF